MKIKYIVPTVGRADSITTMDYITKAVALVSPEDYPRYPARSRMRTARLRFCGRIDHIEGIDKGD